MGAAGKTAADAAKARENKRERLKFVRMTLLTIIHHRKARPGTPHPTAD